MADLHILYQQQYELISPARPQLAKVTFEFTFLVRFCEASCAKVIMKYPCLPETQE